MAPSPLQTIESAPVTCARGLHLKGAEAAAWFEARGWGVVATRSASTQLIVDEIVTPPCTVRRVWHTPMTLASRRTITPLVFPHTLLLQCAGNARLAIDHRASERLEPFGVAVHSASNTVTLLAPEPTARIELQFRSIRSPALETGSDVWSSNPESASWSIVTSLVNSLLNSSVEPSEPIFPLLQEALESTATALLAEHRGHSHLPATTPRRADTLQRADHLICQHAHDPSFTIEVLARRLNVTRRYLARIFAEAGTAPSIRLREERTRIARRLIGGSARLDTAAATRIAIQAGFSSARAMREALARETEEHPATG